MEPGQSELRKALEEIRAIIDIAGVVKDVRPIRDIVNRVLPRDLAKH